MRERIGPAMADQFEGSVGTDTSFHPRDTDCLSLVSSAFRLDQCVVFVLISVFFSCHCTAHS